MARTWKTALKEYEDKQAIRENQEHSNRLKMTRVLRWFCASFNRFEFEMSEEAVIDCYHQGACDEGVSAWQGKIDLSHISDEALREELKEYGAWSDEELQDRTTNECRIIWIAAGDIQNREEKEE